MNEPQPLHPVVQRHAELLGNRVKKNFQHWHKRMARDGYDCFRVYDHDIPEVRAMVDVYADHAVVGVLSRQQTDALPGYDAALQAAVAEALQLPADHVHGKLRRTRPQDGPRYQRLDHTEERLQVREGPVRFWVNLTDYLDTGLFSDHRWARRQLAESAAGKDVLNLFCYTGSFTVAAAYGGAASTTSVDASPAYLHWLRDNLVLNQLDGPQHVALREDVRDFLRDAEGLGQRWDFIVCDPPSFSTRPGRDDFDVQRDHRALVRQCLSLLRPGGVLWFSCNHQRFEPNLSGLLGASVQDWTERSIPQDYRNRQVHRLFCLTAADTLE